MSMEDLNGEFYFQNKSCQKSVQVLLSSTRFKKQNKKFSSDWSC